MRKKTWTAPEGQFSVALNRRALIVNAIDDKAAGFWRRRGFLPSKDDALVLFRSITDIAASLRIVGDHAGGQ
jgi:hypothetical protein